MLLPLLRGWVFPQRNYIDYIASHSLTYKPPIKHLWVRAVGWRPAQQQPAHITSRTLCSHRHLGAVLWRLTCPLWLHRSESVSGDNVHGLLRLWHTLLPPHAQCTLWPRLLLNVIHRAHVLYIHRIEFVACKVLVLGNEQCRCLNEYASFLLGKNLLKLCILFFSHVIIK